MPFKGASTTFNITGHGFLANVVSIGPLVEEIAALPRNILADAAGSHQKYVAGDRIEYGPLEMVVEFDPDIYQATDILELDGVEVNGKLTFPKDNPAATSAANLAGDGFIRVRGFDSVENDEIIRTTIEWRWTGTAAGGEGPDYTAEVGP